MKHVIQQYLVSIVTPSTQVINDADPDRLSDMHEAIREDLLIGLAIKDVVKGRLETRIVTEKLQVQVQPI